MATPSSPNLGTVLILGGSGFLGAHIIRKIQTLHPASPIVALDIYLPEKPIAKVKYVTGDITSSTQITDVLTIYRPTTIFHTISPNPLRKDRTLLYGVNVTGTENLLTCIKQVGSVNALVYTSSSSVVHNSATDLVNATEDLPLVLEPEQKMYYTHTKALAESIVLAANRKNGLLTTAIRPAGLFGEGDKRLVQNMVATAKRNLIIGPGGNVYDWTYVENNAHAQVLAAEALINATTSSRPIPASLRVDGEAFVITNDDPYPFWQFAYALANATGHSVDIAKARKVPLSLLICILFIWEWLLTILTFGTGQTQATRTNIRLLAIDRTFDIGKAKKRLGYVPPITMEEGIRRTAVWFNETYPGK